MGDKSERWVWTPVSASDADGAPGESDAGAEEDAGRGAAVAEQDEKPRGGSATRAKPAPPRVDKLPPYRVLLHNDDRNDMLWVVDALVELTPLDRERALEVMLRAHTRGLCQVLVTHRERAELYVEQLRSKSLVATAEPAG